MSGGGRGRPQPYYSNRGYQEWNRGYNFSSDVNLSNSNGSFQFGSPPPMQDYRRPYRGGGRGGGFRGRGGSYPGGGYRAYYNPQPYGGYEQRGFRPQFYRGRFPRPGPPGGALRNRGGRGYGRGHYQAQKQRRPDGDDPFYHVSMFEDPWRFLMPKRASDNLGKESTKSEAPPCASEGRNSDVADAMEVGDVVEGDGKSDERTGVPVVSSVEEQEVDRFGDVVMEGGEGGGGVSESLACKVGEEVEGDVGEEVEGGVGEEVEEGVEEEVEGGMGEEVEGGVGEEQVVNQDDESETAVEEN